MARQNGCGTVPALTRHQLEILQLMAQGKPYGAIARELGLSERTVRTLTSNRLFVKLGVQNRTEAVVKAQWLGLIQYRGTLSAPAQAMLQLEQAAPGTFRELVEAGLIEKVEG